MPTFKNLKDLERHINMQAKAILQKDVAEKVKDVMQMKVKTEVYDKYTSYSNHPDAYERRYEDGGLADRSNMESKVVGNTLVVENTTKGQDGSRLDGLIEHGQGGGYGSYDYAPAMNSEGDFREPRPFIEETRKELRNTNSHVQEFKKGLHKLGVKTV